MKQAISSGQALTEYGLIAGLVAIAAIGALIALSGSLTGSFGDFKASLKAGGGPGAMAVTAATAGNSTEDYTPVSASNAASMFYNPKAKAAVPLPPDMQKSIQTAGANGTMDVLASQLKQTAASLVASGEMSQEEAGFLNDIANQGYRIAEISGLLEEAAKTCGSDAACFKSQTLTFDGQQYKTGELRDLVGFTSQSDGTVGKSPEVQALWDAYKDAYNGSLKTRPELQGMVETLTGQIADTSSIVNWGTQNILNGDITPAELQADMVRQAEGKDLGINTTTTAEAVITDDSDTVCVTGKGKIAGPECQ